MQILILVCAHLLPFVVCVSVLQGRRKHFKSGQAMKNVCERSEQIVFGTSEQSYSSSLASPESVLIYITWYYTMYNYYHSALDALTIL